MYQGYKGTKIIVEEQQIKCRAKLRTKNVICIKKLFLFEEWYLCFRKIESIEIIKESLPFFFPRYPQQPSALRVRHNKKIHQQKHWKYFQQSPKVIDKTFWTNSKTGINFYPNTSLGKQKLTLFVEIL